MYDDPYRKYPKGIDMDKKNVLTSKTIWGIIILALPIVRDWLGIDLAEEQLQGWIDSGFEIVGFVLAVYGRFAAKTAITVGKS